MEQKELKKLKNKKIRIFWRINGYRHDIVGKIKKIKKDYVEFLIADEMLINLHREKVYDAKMIVD